MKILWKSLATLLFLAATHMAFAQEYGLASYYSDKFHGKPTASGEAYDKNKMTAAHKTLPYGTLIKVTRLDNKKAVVLRVNDRGPYISGRIVDVSRKAADQLDLVTDGTARVKVEVVDKNTEEPTPSKPVAEKKEEKKKEDPKPEPRKAETAENPEPAPQAAPANRESRPTSSAGTMQLSAEPEWVTGKNYQQYDLYKIELTRPNKVGYGVQVASLTNYENVLKIVADLQGKWFKNVLLSIEPGFGDVTTYKVILGPFADRASAENYKKDVKKKMKLEGFVVDLSTLNYE
jgi:rare lipoprotein A